MISQKEIEGIFHWVNQHLKVLNVVPLSNYSKLNIHPITQPKEALCIQFPLIFPSKESVGSFRKVVWNELFSQWSFDQKPYAVSLLSETTSDTPKKLVVFDMDSTLINQEVIDEMARSIGQHDKVAEITEAAMKGNIPFTESLKARCKLLTGLNFQKALQVIPQLSLSPGGEAFLSKLRAQQIKTAVVSGGFQFILRHFQKQYFLDYIYGNELEKDEQDCFTGEVLPPIVDGQYKQKLVANLKEQLSLSADQIVVVGDGANDVLMMGEASTSVSFCGKPKLAVATHCLVLDRNLLWIHSLL